jgi:hypothetical protein
MPQPLPLLQQQQHSQGLPLSATAVQQQKQQQRSQGLPSSVTALQLLQQQQQAVESALQVLPSAQMLSRSSA